MKLLRKAVVCPALVALAGCGAEDSVENEAPPLATQQQQLTASSPTLAAADEGGGQAELDPEFALAYSSLGASYSTYVMKGMGGISYYDEAEAACKRALDLDPGAVEPRVTLVYIYMGSGDKRKARELVEELRREAPNDTTIRNVAGTLYRLDGRYSEAVREFDRQLKINPTEIPEPAEAPPAP